MVLINPQVISDLSEQHKGRLEISFPEEAGCQAFAIPLKPSQETLERWSRFVVHTIVSFSKLRPHRFQDIELWERDDIDGYVCQAIGLDELDYPAKILSRYLGRDVLLVMKGPKPRPCSATSAFPDLKATSMYQDGYPILLASEESLLSVQEKLRKEVGNQGVADRWSEDDLVMER